VAEWSCSGLQSRLCRFDSDPSLTFSFSDAQTILSKAINSWGDSAPAMIAMVYAQWGDPGSAIRWLERSFKSRDAELSGIRTEPLFDPLRNEPRFQAVETAMKFPD
jgi:hypothetical protein